MTRCAPALHLLLGALILLSPGCAPDPWQSNFPTFSSKEDEASLGKRIARSVPRITSPDDHGTGNPTGSLIMVAPGVGLTARHALPEILQKTTTVIDGGGETVVIQPTEVTALMVLQDGIFCWVTLLDRSGCWEDLPDEADMPIVGPYQASDWAVVGLCTARDHALLHPPGDGILRYDMDTPLSPGGHYLAAGWKGGESLHIFEALSDGRRWPATPEQVQDQEATHVRATAVSLTVNGTGSLQGISGGPLLRIVDGSDADGFQPEPVVVGINVSGEWWTPWSWLEFRKPYWTELCVSRPALEPVEVYAEHATCFAKALGSLPVLRSNRLDHGVILAIHDAAGRWHETHGADAAMNNRTRYLADSDDDQRVDRILDPEDH